MNNNTQSHPSDKPVVLKPDRGLSMSQQVLIALLVGVATGVFFGEMTTGLKFIGDIYIGLQQMMVLPYIIISLIGGIGKLTLEQTKQLSLLPVRS